VINRLGGVLGKPLGNFTIARLPDPRQAAAISAARARVADRMTELDTANEKTKNLRKQILDRWSVRKSTWVRFVEAESVYSLLAVVSVTCNRLHRQFSTTNSFPDDGPRIRRVTSAVSVPGQARRPGMSPGWGWLLSDVPCQYRRDHDARGGMVWLHWGTLGTRYGACWTRLTGR
jgi:hypothetical protein